MQVGFYLIWVGALPLSDRTPTLAGLGFSGILFFVVLIRSIYRRRDRSGYSLMDRYNGSAAGESDAGGGGAGGP